MEKYLDAAREIAAKAIPIDGPQIVKWWMGNHEFKSPQNEKYHLGYIPLESKRSYEAKRWVNFDGEYELEVEFVIRGSSEATQQTGTLKFGYDGKDLMKRKVGWDNSKSIRMKTRARLQKEDKKLFHLAMEPGDPPDEGEDKIVVLVKNITMRGPLDGSQKDYPWEFQDIFSEGPPPASQDETRWHSPTGIRKTCSRLDLLPHPLMFRHSKTPCAGRTKTCPSAMPLLFIPKRKEN